MRIFISYASEYRRIADRITVGLLQQGHDVIFDRDGYDQIELDPQNVRRIAFDLATASLDDPRNTDVLHNLAVLFRYAGDTERAHLAANLAEQGAR